MPTAPTGATTCRPEYPTIVYTRILRQLFPDCPSCSVALRPRYEGSLTTTTGRTACAPASSATAGADLIIYGMGEKPTTLVRITCS